MNSETSSNPQPSQSAFRLSVSSKPSSKYKRRSSYDSFTDRLSCKISSQSNENEVIARISTRTSQSIRVTRMLVLVSTCFLILNAPAHLCVIALKIYTITSIDTSIINEHMNNITFINGNSNMSLSQNEHIIEDQIAIHLFYMAVLLTQLIAYASYSINFFLYSFSGIAFRTNLRQLIKKFQRQ